MGVPARVSCTGGGGTGGQKIPACLSSPQVLSHGPGQGGAGRLAGRLLEVPTLYLQLLLLGESLLTRTQHCPLSSCHGFRLGHGVSDLLCLFKSRCVLRLVKVRGVFPRGWQRGHLTPAMSWSGERASPTMLELGSCPTSTLPDRGSKVPEMGRVPKGSFKRDTPPHWVSCPPKVAPQRSLGTEHPNLPSPQKSLTLGCVDFLSGEHTQHCSGLCIRGSHLDNLG